MPLNMVVSTWSGMMAVTPVVMPGLTRYPVNYRVAESDSLFHWIPAFANGGGGGFRPVPNFKH